MTETTEEKDPFEKAKTHICGLPGFSEYFDYIRARKGHQPPTNDFLYAVSRHIASLTKERDELKEKIEPNEYYCTACRDCNWEGSSKFLRVSQFDECDITCPCCHSKNLVDTNIELNDNQSISNLHEYIDMQELRISSINSTSRVIANHNAHLKSQLSNREKEIKELKEKIEPNEYYCTACRDCNWEGSSKFLRVSQFDECDITCPCCHSKNLVDTNIELNDNQSISNLHEYIDMQEFRISSIKSTSRVIANHNAHLKSQLSNRDKEIEELKETVKPAIDCLEALLFAAGEGGANDLEFEFIVDTAIEYGCITKIKLDADIGPDDEEVLCMRLPNMEALASLQSKQGEE